MSDAAPGVRVVLVDDHRLLSQALAVSLEADGARCHVPELRDPQSLLVEVLEHEPDVVLLDLDLGALGSGLDLLGPLARAGVRVLVVSASRNRSDAARAVELGAVGVLGKHVPFDQLRATTLAAARGQEVLGPAERGRLLEEARLERLRRSARLAPFERLSAREATVLRALGDGQSVAAIAARDVVSEATVRSQVRAILTKLGVGSQLEAVAAARHAGFWES